MESFLILEHAVRTVTTYLGNLNGMPCACWFQDIKGREKFTCYAVRYLNFDATFSRCRHQTYRKDFGL